MRAMGRRKTSEDINQILPDTSIEGTVKAESSIRVEGFVRGKVECQEIVVVGVDGRVEGEVYGGEVIVEGSVRGGVIATRLIKLLKTARVEGTIRTQFLVVEEGAQFNGECQMGSFQEMQQEMGNSSPVVDEERGR